MLDIMHGTGWVGPAPKDGEILIPCTWAYLPCTVIDTDWELIKSSRIDIYIHKPASAWQNIRSIFRKLKHGKTITPRRSYRNPD